MWKTNQDLRAALCRDWDYLMLDHELPQRLEVVSYEMSEDSSRADFRAPTIPERFFRVTWTARTNNYHIQVWEQTINYHTKGYE